jgi:hypothetical protein
MAVHASAFSFKNRGCLLIGEPNSGKSTILLSACMKHKSSFVSDDVSVINQDNRLIYPFYRPVGIRSGSFSLISDIPEENYKVVEIDDVRKIMVSPSVLPIELKKEPLRIDFVFFLNSRGCERINIDQCNSKESYKRFMRNMHVGSIYESDFTSVFNNTKFYTSSYSLNVIDKLTEEIMQIIKNENK